MPGVKRRTIDIAFTRARVAVFVDGCFWHCCPVHATWPGANSVWWAEKLRRNVERDRETDELLMTAGWSVVRVWEHVPVEEAVEVVETALGNSIARARKLSVDERLGGVSASEPVTPAP